MQGYATSKLLHALTFGVVILNNLKEHGVIDERMNKNIICVGIAGIGLLSLTHLEYMIIGTNTGSTIELQYVTLYTQMAFELLGAVGGTIFSVGLIFASLTTTNGISAAIAEYCEDVISGKFGYKKAIAIVCVFSAIILILYYVFMLDCQNEKYLAVCKWGIIVSVFFGIMDGIYTYNNLLNLNLDGFVNIYLKLSFAEWKLAWVPACIIVMTVVYLVSKN